MAEMELELRKYERFYSRVSWLLGVSGLHSHFHPILRRTLTVVCFVSLFSVSMSIVNFCFHHTSNLAILSRAMGQGISYSTSFFKFFIFLLHYDDLEYLSEGLTAQYALDLKSSKDRPYLLRRIGTFVNLYQAYSIMTGATLLMFTLKPILVYFLHHKCIRTYLSSYPLQYEPGGPTHWLLYILEVVSAFFMFTSVQGVDSAFGIYCFQMCGEFRVLAARFNELRVSSDYRERIRECAKRHHLLLHSKNRLQSLVGLIVIFLTISGGLVICSLIFQLSEGLKHGAGIEYTLHMIVYLLPKLIQIFMYSYSGDLLAEEKIADREPLKGLPAYNGRESFDGERFFPTPNKSKTCLEAIYHSYWPISCDMRFKKDILIVLAQKPLILTAKGCMFIQFDMFTKIVNTSLSYFFLLQTLMEKQS